MPTSTASFGLTRRQLFPILGAATIAAVAPGTLAAAPGGHRGKSPSAEARFVYVGSYTAPGVPPGGTHPSTAVGIYVFRMDPRDGDLIPIEIVTTDNPSFLALDPTLTHLYSTNENVGGRFSAYAIDQATGTLTFINTQPSHGDFPAHLSVHPSGRYLLGTNYGTGLVDHRLHLRPGARGDGLAANHLDAAGRLRRHQHHGRDPYPS
jgi:6-phosphogluconolactonase (cycloisomerase 2 family)